MREREREREKIQWVDYSWVTVAKECVILSYESGKNNDAVIPEWEYEYSLFLKR